MKGTLKPRWARVCQKGRKYRNSVCKRLSLFCSQSCFTPLPGAEENHLPRFGASVRTELVKMILGHIVFSQCQSRDSPFSGGFFLCLSGDGCGLLPALLLSLQRTTEEKWGFLCKEIEVSLFSGRIIRNCNTWGKSDPDSPGRTCQSSRKPP